MLRVLILQSQRLSHLLVWIGGALILFSAALVTAEVFMLYGDCPCLVYGPYSENIHGFDERVSLSSVKRITGAIALFVAEWCGLERV